MKKLLILFCLVSGVYLINCSGCGKDTEPPIVKIIFPSDESYVPADTIPVRVKAMDNKGVEFVELYVDDTLRIKTRYNPDSSNVYFFSWDASIYQDSSSHTLKARAVDFSDNQKFHSITITVTLQNHPPEVSLIYPPNGDTLGSVVCTLKYRGQDPDLLDTLYYTIYLDTLSSPESVVALRVSDTLFITDTLSYETFYFWKVVVEDKEGLSDTSSVFIFRTPEPNRPPYSPYNFYPPYGDTTVPWVTTLSWECTDPDGDSLRYDLYFDTLSPPVVLDSNLIQPMYPLQDTLLPGVMYYWQVVARDDRGAETSSNILEFQPIKAKTNLLATTGGLTRDVLIKDNLMYVLRQSGLSWLMEIYDISLPFSPILIKAETLNWTPWALYKYQNYIVVSRGSSGPNKLHFFKIISSDSLLDIGFTGVRGPVGGMVGYQNMLYVVDYVGVAGISLDSIKVVETNTTPSWSLDIETYLDYLYVLTDDNRILVYSILNISQILVSHPLSETSVARIKRSNRFLVAGTNKPAGNSLLLYDLIQNQPDLLLLHTKSIPGGVLSISFNSPHLFVSGDNWASLWTVKSNKVFKASESISFSYGYGSDMVYPYVFISTFTSNGVMIYEFYEPN